MKKVEGDGSDGYLNLEEPNDFFKAFHKAVTLDESDVPGTEIAKNLSKWDSAQFMYHKHASEWYDKAPEKESIWDTLLGKFTSPHFAELIEHEKERVDNLVWMQDASGLGLPKEMWNWWPIGHGVALQRQRLCNIINAVDFAFCDESIPYPQCISFPIGIKKANKLLAFTSHSRLDLAVGN